MDLILGILVGFGISVVTLYLVVEVFGTPEAKPDFPTVAAAAVLITVVGLIVGLIPYLGWLVGLIINILIIMNLLECSGLTAFFAIIIWGVLQMAAGSLLGYGLGLF